MSDIQPARGAYHEPISFPAIGNLHSVVPTDLLLSREIATIGKAYSVRQSASYWIGGEHGSE